MSLTAFPSTTFVVILSCRRYTLGLTSIVADICGCARKLCSDDGDASGGPFKSHRRDGVDRDRAFKVSRMDLEATTVPRRDIVAFLWSFLGTLGLSIKS